MYKKFFLIVFCTIVIITQVSCVSKKPFSKTGFYLNTSCTIEIRGMSKSDASNLIDEAFEKCTYYENLFSRSIEGSEIYNINNAQGKATKVSPETLEVIKTSLELSRLTDGKFDITLGQLIALWDFTGETPSVPSQDMINEALATSGYKKVLIEGDSVKLTDPKTWLDLGAIAKGYIADKIVTFLEANGVTSGVVNLGGNIVTIGDKEDGSPWKIGIEAPYSDRSEIVGSLDMSNQTVVTSGIYERYFTENGKNYHHILDPKTGYPVETDIVSISILSKEGNSTLCDSYSTICLILGKEEAIKFMEDKEGFEFCIIDTAGEISQSQKFNLVE